MAASIVSWCRLQPLIRLSMNGSRHGKIINVCNIRMLSDDAKENNCDFFGIPDDYKLQHHRHLDSAGDSGDTTTKLKLNSNKSSQSESESHHHRKDMTSDFNLVETYHTTHTHSSARNERRNKRAEQMKNHRTRCDGDGVVSFYNNNDQEEDTMTKTKKKFTKNKNTKTTYSNSNSMPMNSEEEFNPSIQRGRSRNRIYNESPELNNLSVSHHLKNSMAQSEMIDYPNNTNNNKANINILNMSVQADQDIAIMTELNRLKSHQPIIEHSNTISTTNVSSTNSDFVDIDKQYFDDTHLKKQFDVSPSSSDNYSDFQKETSRDKMWNSSSSGVTGFNNNRLNEESEKLNKDRSLSSNDDSRISEKLELEKTSNIFDDYYFGEAVSKGSTLTRSSENNLACAKESTNSEFNNIDDQYFGKTSFDNTEGNAPDDSRISEKLELEKTSNIFDDYYFGEAVSTGSTLTRSSENNLACAKESTNSEFNNIDDQYFGKTSFDNTEGNAPEGSNAFSDFVSSYMGNSNNVSHHDGNDEMTHFRNVESQSPSRSEKLKESSQKQDNLTNRKYLFKKKTLEMEGKASQETTTAFDLAMKIRQEIKTPQRITDEILKPQAYQYSSSAATATDDNDDSMTKMKGRVDSKGFRILSDQVLELHKMPSMDVLEFLKTRVIFDHEDFLVIDKPYGLPSIGQEKDPYSLSSLLPALGKMLPRKSKASDLHLVHGLDRDVTGAVMLAKNSEVAYMLTGLFKANEIFQRMWAITKGVPSPRKGIIDIPIGVGKVGKIHKMVLRPQYSRKDPNSGRSSKAPSVRAVTEFSVLSSHLQSALVECKLQTNSVKHQVRVHLSSGLNTPILGDHKYSHFSKLAPQKLDMSTLELLHVRQAKVRHIPLHLHCHSLVLPDYKSRTFVITSRLPQHFSKNMKSLKLYLPK